MSDHITIQCIASSHHYFTPTTPGILGSVLYRGRHMKAWDPSIGPPSGGISPDTGLLRDIMAAFDPLNPDGDDGSSGEFAKLYSPIGRESIPPERLMRALLLQAFYSIRSDLYECRYWAIS